MPAGILPAGPLPVAFASLVNFLLDIHQKRASWRTYSASCGANYGRFHFMTQEVAQAMVKDFIDTNEFTREQLVDMLRKQVTV